ncbi:hypothetical protein U2F10_13600 [Leptothoe sp. EHU-05/26/07-4]
MRTLAKWSINDYHQMVAAGILDNRQVELLAGETSSKRHRKPHYLTMLPNGILAI